MKKYFLLLFLLLVMPISVYADHMYSVDMSIYIEKNGIANIEETWVVEANGGSEWYKAMYNLGGSELYDYKVSMDGKALTYKDWNVNESLSAKAGYYGINYSNEGMELCFGKSDMKKHTFKLEYKVSNYVFNTNDSQVLYWTLMPNVSVDNFSVNVTSYYKFPDTLDVWGYGYKGYAYVKDGKISMSNEGGLNGDYVVLLVKFPMETFDTNYRVSGYDSFDSVLNRANEGTFEYDYGDTNEYKPSFWEKVIGFIFSVATFIPFIVFGILAWIITARSGYGYKDNKTIDKKNTMMFRDIPCNKDIYYANALVMLNNFSYKETNIFGAIILKWVRQKKIGFKNEQGVFNKEKSSIDLTMNPTFDNPLEQELFDIMYKASGDGILEAKELEKWCRKHYDKFFGIFKRITNEKIDDLKSAGHIYKRHDKTECKKTNVMDDTIYNDSQKLYGLKLYLQEFSRMDTKEVMEVHLWDEYLMFAYIFGIADKVALQLKNLYPEVLQNPEMDYNTIVYVNNISRRSVSAASAARSAAESYSSGGGGFSSGGGGGGSFGGGGGMGGR